MTVEECKALLPQELKYPLPDVVIDNLIDVHAICIKHGLENNNMSYALLAALVELRERRGQEGER